jgi:transcriptional regulator with XRE-family HTH domain
MTTEQESRHAARQQGLALADRFRAFAAHDEPEHQPTWAKCTELIQEAAALLAADISPADVRGSRAASVTRAQRVQFGQLVRDKRNAAGLSRLQLAHRAKLSDSTIKFLESARHPPSRATLIRLIGVEELQLSWADVPGEPSPPRTPTTSKWNAAPGPTASAIGPVFLVLERLDFDELGDPVFVWRTWSKDRMQLPAMDLALETAPERAGDLSPPKDLRAEIELVPLRR